MARVACDGDGLLEAFRAAVANLEAHGYRYDPIRTARDTRMRRQAESRSRSTRIVLGTALLCAVLLAIEVIILKR